jgi:hypothetical protein
MKSTTTLSQIYWVFRIRAAPPVLRWPKNQQWKPWVSFFFLFIC